MNEHLQQKLASKKNEPQKLFAEAFGVDDKDMDLTPYFVMWSREVVSVHRHKAESLLLASSCGLQHSMNVLDRHSHAKQLLTSSWDGPEAQLSRLSYTLDTLIKHWDPTIHVPVSRPPKQHDMQDDDGLLPTPGTNRWNETVHIFEEWTRTGAAMSSLQAEALFVLKLRFFSAWLRAVTCGRQAQGQAFMGVRRDVQATTRVKARSRQTARSFVARLVRTAHQKVLRNAWDEWSAMVILRRIVLDYRATEEARLKGRLRCLSQRAHATATRFFLSERDSNLRVVVTRWANMASVSRSETTAQSILQQAAQQAAQKAAMVKASAGTMRSRFSLLLFERDSSSWKDQAFRDWAMLVLHKLHMRRKQRDLSCTLSQRDQALLKTVFTVFASRSYLVMARRVTLRMSFHTTDLLSGEGLLQLVNLVFSTWTAEVRVNQAVTMPHKAQALADRTKDVHKKRTISFMQEMLVSDLQNLVHLALKRWSIIAENSRHHNSINSQKAELETARANFEAQQTKLAQQQGKLVKAKAAALFGVAYGKPRQQAALLAWFTFTQEAVLGRKAEAMRAQQKPRGRSCSQWLQFSIECVLVQRGRLLLPEVLCAWQRSTLHFRSSRERLRKTALLIGNGVVACGSWNLAVHIILAWRQAAMAAAVERTTTKLHSAMVLLQALSRAFFAALRHWEGRAASLPSSSTETANGATAAAAAAATATGGSVTEPLPSPLRPIDRN